MGHVIMDITSGPLINGHVVLTNVIIIIDNVHNIKYDHEYHTYRVFVDNIQSGTISLN